MPNFGETLFGGSAFVRWTLTPFVLLFAFLMPLMIPGWTPTRVALTAGIELMCLALLAGFWLPARFGHWAFRGLAGLVFLFYSIYLVNQVFFGDAPFKLIEGRAGASPRNALLGFIVIGLPCFWFALFGKFTARNQVSRTRHR